MARPLAPWVRWAPAAWLILLAPVLAFGTQAAASGVIRIVVRDAADKPLAQAKVELRKTGTAVSTELTSAEGQAEFKNLSPGAYEVDISLDGYESVSQTDVAVDNGTLQDLVFGLAPKEEVNVHAGGNSPVAETPPALNLQPSILKPLPTRPATVADALPLVPGVVRQPTGGLVISGTDEHRSALVVNHLDATDPATGQFGVTVPVDIVQSVSVFQTPYLAEFGRFTAGVVSVETRRGGDKWKFELNDPFPDFRIFSGHLRGVRDATPRVDFNGPLVAGKLFFSEGLEYEIKKTPVKTLAFPNNETRREGVNSFTQLDYLVSNSQTLTGTLHISPWHSNFIGLDFFNPQVVTPAFRASDYTGTVIDRVVFGGSLLESSVGIKMFSGNVWAQGLNDMVLTPTGNLGSYFSQQNRDASRFEWLETYGLAPISAFGKHNIKVGSVVTRTTNRGEFLARPIDVEDTSGQLLKRIEFVGGSPFNRHDLEVEFFGQDHWELTPHLALDLGTRVDWQAITETFRVAPRAGIAWVPGGGDSTVIRGGFGLFYDRVPLGVYSFGNYPEQLVTTYGPNGQVATSQLFVNLTEQALAHFPFIHREAVAGNFAPYSATWNVELDRRVIPTLHLRANYLQSNSSGVVVVTPGVVHGENALVLGGGGKSRYRQLELTASWNPNAGTNLYFSYVHSSSTGDLNEFNNYLGNFPFPIVRPNEVSNLPGDIPNRFLAWGVIKLAWQMRVAPIIEYRNGFPYSVVDARQNYVGAGNSYRYPTFFSADSRVSKDVKVSDKYTLRFSVSCFNISDHFNPTSVHANIADPQYGLFFGSYQRKYTADFDVLF